MKMKKYYKFELDISFLNIVANVLYIIAFIGCYLIFKDFFQNLKTLSITYFFLGIIGYLILHELCHGLGYTLFVKEKRNIKYGIVLEKGVFYAMCQEEISKMGILVSLLMPILVLTVFSSIFAIIFSIPVLMIYSILNFVGAIGDIVLLFLLIRLPKDVTYMDFDNMIGAYFISKNGLTNVRSIGIKCTEEGFLKDIKIEEEIPRLYISSSSKKIILISFLVGIIIGLIGAII